MLNIGVIGTGGIARSNVRALLETGRVRMVALYNRTEDKARALNAEMGLHADVYGDLDAMLDGAKLDAALIQTPHALHFPQFMACAERGLSILIEKPLGISSAECEAMMEAAEKHGVRAYVCHTQRYIPQIRGLLDAAEDAELGRLLHVSDVLGFEYFTKTRPAWYLDVALAGGGPLLTHGAHQLDRLLLALGDDARVLASRVDWGGGRPGIERGYAAFGEGGGASFSVLFAGAQTPHESGMTLYFEHGTLRANLFDTETCPAGLWQGDTNGWRALPLPYPDDAATFYRMQFEALLDALEGKPSDAPTLSHATKVLRLIDAIRERDASP